MKHTPKIVVTITALLIMGLIGGAKPVSAAPYAAGCYVTSQGSAYQKATCPNASPDDAARYATGCWVSAAGSGASTSYKQFDCAGDTANNATATSDTTPKSSGLDDPLKFGDCPSGQIFNVAGEKSGCVDAPTHQCGSGTNVVDVSFDFGCLGPAYGKELNPILDVAFALFRFLSAGVGLVVIGSIIIAGIQYSASRGNPQATGAAIKRITNALVGLLIYIFAFAILNFIVPGGLFL